jgi:hypothetical protein
MSTLDEITKEKQRVSEALAHIDVQREKLTGQLGELEATERVLARYSKGQKAKKTVSARTPTTATKAAAPARQRGRTTPAKPAGGKSASPTLGEQVLALADGKTQQEITAACKGGAPEPCRRRHCPAQASWPHRTARREALRHAVGEDGATRRGLILQGIKRAPPDSERSPPSLPRSSPVIAGG